MILLDLPFDYEPHKERSALRSGRRNRDFFIFTTKLLQSFPISSAPIPSFAFSDATNPCAMIYLNKRLKVTACLANQ
jgi:hypothetical protein